MLHDDTCQEPEKDACCKDDLHQKGQPFGVAGLVYLPGLWHLAYSHTYSGNGSGDER